MPIVGFVDEQLQPGYTRELTIFPIAIDIGSRYPDLETRISSSN
jgi:hypothetical protein